MTARRLATDALLGHACRGLSEFGLKALYLGCRRGRLPALVTASLDDSQIRLIGGLIAHPEGRRQVEQAVDVEVDFRTWGTLQ